MELKEIDYKTAIDFLLPRHYSGRKPQVTHAFGWFESEVLKAVITFGKPASNSLCIGVCGKEFSSKVIELNRMCRTEDLKEPLSKFISGCFSKLKHFNYIIVSYSDTAMNHNGYVYQATNFYYTGCTKTRTDKYTEGNKHSRHYDKNQDNTLRKVRSSKHRYIYFCTDNKRTKKLYLKNLKYKILPYPKGINKNYELGTFLKPIIVEKRNYVSI